MPCIGNVPTIAASGSISEPSGADISTTTLFTPAASGVFRVSVYFEGAALNGNSSATLAWTDGSGSASATLQIANYPWALSGTGGSSWSDVVFHSTATDIQISLSRYRTSTAYTVYYIVEQLA